MPNITITVKASNDQKYSIEVDSEATVLALKELIHAKSSVPAEQQRLIYSGRVLKDVDGLSVYKISEGHTVHMVKGASRAPAASTASRPTNTADTGISTRATPASTQPAAETTPNANVANPFAAMFGGGGMGGMGGMGGFGGGGMGGFGNMGGMGGMMPNEAALNDPMFQAALQAIMTNPAILDNVLASNPELSRSLTPEMRARMTDPRFLQAMSDPNMMRNLMQMASLMGGLGGGGGMPFGGAGGMGNNNAAANPFAMFGAGAGGAPGTTPSTNSFSGSVPASTTSPSSGQAGGGADGQTLPPLGGPFNNPALMQQMMQQMMQNMGGAGGMSGGMGGAPVSNEPPEIRFQNQLQQLQDMGFYDATQNIQALQMVNGNVNAAVEWLLSQPR